MSGVNVVYLNDMLNASAVQSIISTMDEAGVKRLIGSTALGIYDEVPGAFSWNKAKVGIHTPALKSAAKVVEESDIEYTLLRLTWLYNQEGNENYHLLSKGTPL